jgi:hypothetical protein
MSEDSVTLSVSEGDKEMAEHAESANKEVAMTILMQEATSLTITGDIQLQQESPRPASTGAAKDLAKMLGAGAIGAGAIIGSQIALDRPEPVVEDPPAIVQPVQPDHTATIRPM